jgi:CheY-like chemotaxis protein
MIVEVLEEQGYRVLSAADGASALALATEHAGQLDLVLTDVVLPGMNGREIVERLSALRPGIRAVYMSGYSDGTISDRGLLSDERSLVEKPFTASALAQAVRKALDR